MDPKQLLKPFKPRRAHTKSRNGCAYCRRRRIKCDEAKPQCHNCAYRKQPCEYPSEAQKAAAAQGRSHKGPSSASLDLDEPGQTSEAALPNSPSTSPTSWPLTPLLQTSSEPFQALSASLSPDIEVPTFHEDLHLFHYYLDPASRSVGAAPPIAHSHRLSIMAMAATNEGMLCALLAVTAAAFCVDALVDGTALEHADDVQRLLAKSDLYHDRGLQAVRRQVALGTPRNLEVAHVLSAVLFPYALARRRLVRLLKTQTRFTMSETYGVNDDDHPTNVQWATLLRGINTIGTACCNSPLHQHDSPNPELVYEGEVPPASVSAYILQAIEVSKEKRRLSATSAPQTVDVDSSLMSIISVTREGALDALQGRVDALQVDVRRSLRTELPTMAFPKASEQLSKAASISACSLAVDILISIGNALFPENDDNQHPSHSPPLDPMNDEMANLGLDDRGTHPRLRCLWLNESLRLPHTYHPSLPLMPVILPWINRLPEDFMAILELPWPSRVPAAPSEGGDVDYDYEIQMLAWDIFAHWLVFVMLVEREAWWIGDLGRTDIKKLANMIRRHPQAPRDESMSDYAQSQGKGKSYGWWPMDMCSVAEQLQRYRER
ncbi:hypothetical protein PV08_01270 [Exophiala spinifera]|uniref:Zn(2)-C6 fungal-type domain-containing protein n=1 Tax=Exophiala spinifera TaxID=91928 RepID=A0A0D2BP46_9EURO|nr:uncharacterized protein PV08_01270 [Exophiala spinifera]KIW20693.1 hypothetical protein PV08_01270 [Exophiala spinifera]